MPVRPSGLKVRLRPYDTLLGLLLLVSAGPALAHALPTLHVGESIVIDGQAGRVDTGTMHGLVTDADGVPIIAAAIHVSGSNGLLARNSLTDRDGKFSITGLVAGTYQVAASYQGFDTITAQVDVQAGSTVELTTFALKLSTVSTEIDVLPQDVLRRQELHAEEKQRLAGFIPNFYVSYRWDAPALTTKEKYLLAFRNVRDPGNLLLVGTVAGVQQADDDFNGYKQGAKGYGRRYGADLGNLVFGTFLGGAVFPSIFHQDPRYFYRGTGTFKSRLVYALSSAVITRGDNGKRQFAIAGVLGDFSAGAISNLYYAPEDRHGAGLTIENGFLGLAGDALNGLVQEFFFKQLTPKPKKKH